MGGWDEEAWHARLQHARCLRTLGDDGGFLRVALTAFHQRPHRAEPLYDLARYFRDRGMHEVSVLFSEPGLSLPLPEQDVLFLEDFVYSVGIREEFSIAAFYTHDPARKDHGRAVCNAIALDREAPEASRALARSNLVFYIEPSGVIFPSVAHRVAFNPPDGYWPMNPSIATSGEQILMIQRCVNFTLTEDGRYETPDNGPVRTRNFLLRLDRDLATLSATEILPPIDLPEPAFGLVLGFEDARLFFRADELWCSATVRELTQEGWCEQVLAQITCPAGSRAGWRIGASWCRLATKSMKRTGCHKSTLHPPCASCIHAIQPAWWTNTAPQSPKCPRQSQRSTSAAAPR